MKIDFTPYDLKVEQGFLRKVISPCGKFVLYNYNDRCTFEKAWDEYTLNARGSIYNIETGEIVARAFEKIFNFEELPLEKQKALLNSENQDFMVTEKVDGCFTHNTKLNLWEGGTIKIGDIVKNKLTPTLIGMNLNGDLVPTKVTNWFNHGTKNNWLELTVDCSVSKKSGDAGFANKIKVTSNHSIFLNGKWQPTVNAKINDIVINYEETICSLTKKYINDMLLGDGSISPTHNAFRFTTTSKQDHLEYVNFRKELLGENFSHVRNRISGYGTPMLDLVSFTLKSLKSIRDEWYPNNKKIVPTDLSWIDDLSIAIWYMDDGSRSKHFKQKDRACFATNGFSENDCKRLANKLQQMYQVDCSVYNSKGWSIRINAGRNNEIEKFWKAIRKYIPDCMQYKLPEKHQGFYNYTINPGKKLVIKKEIKILNIKKLENKKENFKGSSRTGYDISTETTNYFAKGMLVHNSLGILAYYGGQWRLSTRGSFTSDQAIRGQEILEQFNYTKLNIENTYLVEIVYPENKIIVNYGNISSLFLLTSFNTKTGIEDNTSGTDVFVSCGQYKFNSIEDLIQTQCSLPWTEEGFVVRFSNGERVKFKSKEYMKIARIKANMSPLTFWEKMVESPKALEDFMVSLPEELRADSEKIEADLQQSFFNVSQQVTQTQIKVWKECFEVEPWFMVANTKENKKKLGLYLKANPIKYGQTLFYELDMNREALRQFILKEIRPTGNVIRGIDG